MRLSFFFSRHNNNNVVSAALRAVGNIVTGNDNQTQLILSCNALPCILQLLSSQKETIRKEACWTISNIAAGNRQQIQAVIDAQIFPSIVDLLSKADFKTRKKAAWAITNATSGGTMDQIKYLVRTPKASGGFCQITMRFYFVLAGSIRLCTSHVRTADRDGSQDCDGRAERS